MAINLPNKGQLDSRIGMTTVALRDALREVADLYNNLTQIGQGDLATLGYTADDINALLATFGALDQLYTAYQGGGYAGPALPFNFEQATSAWWNGV